MSIESTVDGTNPGSLPASPPRGGRTSQNVDVPLPESIPAPAVGKERTEITATTMVDERLQAFVDKLAERLAFERGGMHLYDTVIAKCQAHAAGLEIVTVRDLEQIRAQEARHVLLLKECLEQLGADPTARTPGADLGGMEAHGLLQMASDPRTSLAQTLHAALCAELVDNAGWQSLISLAQGLGKDEMARRFRAALDQESVHLANVNDWYEALTLAADRPGTTADAFSPRMSTDADPPRRVPH